MAKISQMGQQTNRTVRSTAETVFNKIRDGLIQRYFGVSEMILAAKTGNVEPFVRPQGMNIKQGRQFGQIEKHEKQVILKHVGSRPEPPVPNGPFIYAAMQGFDHDKQSDSQFVEKYPKFLKITIKF